MELIISFKEFKDILDKMRDINDAEDKINSICRDLNFKHKEYAAAGRLPNMVSDVVFLFEKIFNDRSQWISYWVFEKNFGRSLELGDVREEDGTPVPMTTIEELWDVLIDNLNTAGK